MQQQLLEIILTMQNRATAGFQQATTTLGGILQNMSVALQARLALSIEMAVRNVAKSTWDLTMSLDEAMHEISTVATQLKDKDLEELRQGILDLSTDVGITAPKLARSIYTIFSSMGEGWLDVANVSDEVRDTLKGTERDAKIAAFGWEEALEVAVQSSKMAVAGLTDVESAAKLLITILNAFPKGMYTAEEAADILFKTVELGVPRFSEMSAQMGDMMAFASLTGVSLEELGAAWSTITRRGLNAAEAGTALTWMMRALLKQTPKAAEAADGLGLSLDVAAVKSDGLGGIIEQLSTQLGGEERAITLVTLALSSNKSEFEDLYLTTIENVAGLKERIRYLEETGGATEVYMAKLRDQLRVEEDFLLKMKPIADVVNAMWSEVEIHFDKLKEETEYKANLYEKQVFFLNLLVKEELDAVTVTKQWTAAEAETAYQLGQVFGNVRSLRGILPLMVDRGKMFASMLDDMGDSSGAAGTAFGKMMGSAQKGVDVFGRHVEKAQVELGTSYLGILTTMLDNLGPKISNAMKEILEFDERVSDILYKLFYTETGTLDENLLAVWVNAVDLAVEALPSAIEKLFEVKEGGIADQLRDIFQSAFKDETFSEVIGGYWADQIIAAQGESLIQIEEGSFADRFREMLQLAFKDEGIGAGIMSALLEDLGKTVRADEFKTAFDNMVTGEIQRKFFGIKDKISGYGGMVIEVFKTDMLDHFAKRKEEIYAIPQNIADKFTGLVDNAEEWGEDLISLFAEGIENNLDILESAMEKWADSMVTGLEAIKEDYPMFFDWVVGYYKEKLGLMAEDAEQSGKDLSENFGKGIKEGMPAIEEAAQAVEDEYTTHFGFDEAANDMKAIKWGEDFIKYISQGIMRGVDTYLSTAIAYAVSRYQALPHGVPQTTGAGGWVGPHGMDLGWVPLGERGGRVSPYTGIVGGKGFEEFPISPSNLPVPTGAAGLGLEDIAQYARMTQDILQTLEKLNITFDIGAGRNLGEGIGGMASVAAGAAVGDYMTVFKGAVDIFSGFVQTQAEAESARQARQDALLEIAQAELRGILSSNLSGEAQIQSLVQLYELNQKQYLDDEHGRELLEQVREGIERNALNILEGFGKDFGELEGAYSIGFDNISFGINSQLEYFTELYEQGIIDQDLLAKIEEATQNTYSAIAEQAMSKWEGLLQHMINMEDVSANSAQDQYNILFDMLKNNWAIMDLETRWGLAERLDAAYDEAHKNVESQEDGVKLFEDMVSSDNYLVDTALEQALFLSSMIRQLEGTGKDTTKLKELLDDLNLTEEERALLDEIMGTNIKELENLERAFMIASLHAMGLSKESIDSILSGDRSLWDVINDDKNTIYKALVEPGGLKEAIEGVKDAIYSAQPLVTNPRGPWLQEGGITTHQTLAMLHPNEAVIPLDRMPLGNQIIVQGPLVKIEGAIIRDDRDINKLANAVEKKLNKEWGQKSSRNIRLNFDKVGI